MSQESLVADPIPAEDESLGGTVVRKTPWWTISTGLHVALALILGWFWVVQVDAELDIVTVARREPRVIKPEMDPPDPTFKADKPLKHEKPLEEVVVMKAPVEETTQSPTDEEFEKMKGEAPEFASNQPFKSHSNHAVIGVGRAGAGSFGHRVGGKKLCIQDGGGSPITEDAVTSALRWLARHQSPEGGWSTTGYTARCTKSCTPNPGEDAFDVGNTSLALMAFLGAGYSHLSKDEFDGICFGDVVRRGLRYLMSRQDPEGCIGSRGEHKYMYNHLLAALALSEAYGLTGSNLFKDQAQKAVDFTLAAQNPGRAWRYSYKCGDNDSSVTGWAVMVLKSAEISGLSLAAAGYSGSRAWLDEVTDASYGRVGYNALNTGKVFVPGKNEQYDHHEALTAIGVLSRIFIDRRKDARMSNGADLLLRDKPVWNDRIEGIDFYYWYYASLALFQYDGPSGPKWKAWNESMKDALVKNQNPKSMACRNGSWEPIDRWSCEGGRVYATAINALTLEVYYRYANVFTGSSRP